MSPSLDDQIAEVERELAMRRRVYAKFVLSGKMTKTAADRQTANMQAVLESLHRLKGLEK